MECHDYTDQKPCHNERDKETFPPELVYKLSPKETQELVKLRMSNQNLFSGKRNASMCGWSTILRHMGLQDKITHYQAAKKWENLKKRYKDVKYTVQGDDSKEPQTPHWPLFTLMKDAMEGRLDTSATVLTTTQQDRFEVLNCPKRKKRRLIMPAISSVESLAPESSSEFFAGPEVEVTLNQEIHSEGSLDIGHILEQVDNEKKAMDQQRQMMEREHQLLQRERSALDREVASLERERASLDRDRAAIEREKALLDRERALVEREKEAVSRGRQALEQERIRLVGAKSESDNTDSADRKEKFLFLFEKLISNF